MEKKNYTDSEKLEYFEEIERELEIARQIVDRMFRDKKKFLDTKISELKEKTGTKEK